MERDADEKKKIQVEEKKNEWSDGEDYLENNALSRENERFAERSYGFSCSPGKMLRRDIVK